MSQKTIIEFFEECVKKFGNNIFLKEKANGVWTECSYAKVRDDARRIGAGLMSIGVQKGDKITMFSEGRNLWILSELGIFYAGAVNVPISFKIEEEDDLVFKINHSESRFIIVSRAQLPKIRAIKDRIPEVRKIIVLDVDLALEDDEMPVSHLFALGDMYLSKHPGSLENRAYSIEPDDYATISYTSGTTSDPKGVLLTHGNYTVDTISTRNSVFFDATDTMLIILPLDHCFAHVAGMYLVMSRGASLATVPFGKSSREMLRNIPATIQEVRPHLMLVVPALLKNFKKGIETAFKEKSKLARGLINYVFSFAEYYNKDWYNRGGLAKAWMLPFLWLHDRMIFRPLRLKAFGGRMKYFIGGAAMFDVDMQKFYGAMGIPVYQGYGLSEATPVVSTNNAKQNVLGTCGHVLDCMEVKVCNEAGETLPVGEVGELVVRGGNVMAGYWKNPSATEKVIDKDGWLHTGDMGRQWPGDPGVIYVMGRFKSLLIGEDGEKYSPEIIEETLVSKSPYIEQAMMVNNQKPYTIALVYPDKKALTEFIKSRYPKLDPAGPEAKIKMLEKIEAEVNMFRTGRDDEGLFPQKWLPSAICVLPEGFTEQNGLMNATSKVIRGKVEQRYQAQMDYAYTPEGKSVVNSKNLSSL
ncbi:MAG: AMP-binding protein [Bacteroidales bacterium]|nr:AMP-binding protein [Bacteroidales bacterium]